MSNKESRIKSLPDVFMLDSGLVQFKYVQDISNANDVNFCVGMAGGHKYLQVNYASNSAIKRTMPHPLIAQFIKFVIP